MSGMGWVGNKSSQYSIPKHRRTAGLIFTQKNRAIKKSKCPKENQVTIDIYLVAAIALATGVIITIATTKSKTKALTRDKENSEQRVKDLEKQIHLEVANHLKIKNELTIEYHQLIKKERDKANTEGFDLGVASCKKDHQIEITNIRAEHKEILIKERLDSELKGKELARAEIEAQSKAFSVLLRPYVKIEKVSGLIFNDHKSHTGYQFQLLINGVPAFQPHIIIEKTENLKSTEKETVMELIKLAKSSVDSAITTYLNGATGGMLKVGGEIIENQSA